MKLFQMSLNYSELKMVLFVDRSVFNFLCITTDNFCVNEVQFKKNQ